MHEYSATHALVGEVVRQLKTRGVEKVLAIRLRRGSAFSEAALRQAYAASSAGTMLENAELIVETIDLTFRCACGYARVINSEDLIGHMFVCPDCGSTREVDDA